MFRIMTARTPMSGKHFITRLVTPPQAWSLLSGLLQVVVQPAWRSGRRTSWLDNWT